MAALLFQIFQHVFEVVAQRGQATQADDGARPFQGVRHALGRSHVIGAGFARNHFAHQLHQCGSLIGRLLKEAVHQLLVGILGHLQRHVIG